MALRKVSEGEPFEPSAGFHNATVDAIRAVRGMQASGVGGVPSSFQASHVVVQVQNKSGTDRDLGDVLAFDGMVFDPSTSEDAFKDNPIVLKGYKPQVSTLSSRGMGGRFGILLEPLAVDEIGAALIAGVVRCQVNLAATWHRHAIIEHDSVQLKSNPDGPCQILAIDSGSTGVKWAVVHVGYSMRLRLAGKLDGALNADSSATFSVWTWNGSAYADSTNNITVYAPWVLASGSVASGKRGVAGWNIETNRWELVEGEC